jgi:hypothetical protein
MPGNKPLAWKEKKHILRMEDQFEKEALLICLGLQDYPPSGPIILQPELHVMPCQFGH